MFQISTVRKKEEGREKREGEREGGREKDKDNLEEEASSTVCI